MKIIILGFFILLLAACSINGVDNKKSDFHASISGEYLMLSGLTIDMKDFGKPTATGIIINPENADLHKPQAWSRIIDGSEYWYYNWDGAMMESKSQRKRLPTVEELKLFLPGSISYFNQECPGFRQGGSNLWSIPNKSGKSYWSSTDLSDPIYEGDYAMQTSLYGDNGKCDILGLTTRMEKWQGFSVRGVPLE